MADSYYQVNKFFLLFKIFDWKIYFKENNKPGFVYQRICRLK